MRGESVIRPSGRTLPVANRLAICSSVVVVLASSVYSDMEINIKERGQ